MTGKSSTEESFGFMKLAHLGILQNGAYVEKLYVASFHICRKQLCNHGYLIGLNAWRSV